MMSPTEHNERWHICTQEDCKVTWIPGSGSDPERKSCGLCLTRQPHAHPAVSSARGVA